MPLTDTLTANLVEAVRAGDVDPTRESCRRWLDDPEVFAAAGSNWPAYTQIIDAVLDRIARILED